MADIVQSCGLERATGAVDAALQCIIQMAASPALQVPKRPSQQTYSLLIPYMAS